MSTRSMRLSVSGRRVKFKTLRAFLLLLIAASIMSWVVYFGCGYREPCDVVYLGSSTNMKHSITYDSKEHEPEDQIMNIVHPKAEIIKSQRQMPEMKPKNPPDADLPSKVATTSDFSWTSLSKNWKLFSSYIDKRSFKGSHGVFKKSLVTMGYEKGPATNDLECVVIWTNNSRSILKDNARRIMISEGWKKRVNDFRAYFYRCNLSVSGTPRYVSLIEKNSAHISTIPRSAFIPVVDPQSPRLYEFGVCFETPLFGDKYKQIVIDSIEMNQLLGAKLLTLYIHDGAESTMNVLKSYSKQGILDGVFNWADNIPSPTYMRGVLVGIQDCLYRNMYKVRYLVYCDFDEVITPKKHINWHDLMEAIETEKRAFFSFNYVAFHTNKSENTVSYQCPGKLNRTYKMPQYLATRNRSVNVFPNSRQAKSIVKPIYQLFLHVHNQGVVMQGYRNYFVPKHIGLLQHFRDNDDPRFTKYNSSVDYSMDKFKLPLLTAVKKKVCG